MHGLSDSSIFVGAVGVPLYHFIRYPFLYCHIPTMLKRISWGLSLISLSYGVSVELEQWWNYAPWKNIFFAVFVDAFTQANPSHGCHHSAHHAN